MTETRNSAPALRFKDEQRNEYPDWEQKLLGDISRLSKGKGISKTDVKENGIVKCIRYGELYTRYGETISNVFSSTNVPVSELVLSHKNDVIIPASGETALDIASATCITIEGVALGGDINIIRCQQNGIFLTYYLISKQKDIARLAQGSSIIHLYSAQLASLNLRIPSKKEQQKIASFLSSVDAKIEKLGKKKALLEQYKKGMMQKLFSQEIRFKDAQGKDYRDWEEKKLGEIGKVVTGKTPSTMNQSLWGGEIQFITPSDINDNNKYQTSTERYIKQTKDIRVLPLKSIIYTCIASIGKICISVKPCATNQQINALTPSNCYDNEFIYYSLLKLTPRIKATQATTTLPIINKTEFKKIKISIPCLSEQQKIAAFLAAIDKKIELVVAQLKQAQIFKKGLLQQMFV